MASILDVLAGAGNLLDLPGSSLRDILAGRNPFDQWATPFSGDNRATGRDVLQPFLGANQETGMAGWLDNPMEGFKDIAGFGAEVLLDPLNLIPAGAVSRALRGRKGTRSANAAMKAERGGKYGYVNPKVAGRAMPDRDFPQALRSQLEAERYQLLKQARDESPLMDEDVVDFGGNHLAAAGMQDQYDTITSQIDAMGVPENPTRRLGYTPAPENPMFPGREVVFHGGRDWTPSATPQHPYGMFDLGRLKTGEGANIFGPGAYFADVEATSARYKRIVDEMSPEPDQNVINEIYRRLQQEAFPVGKDILRGQSDIYDEAIDTAYQMSDEIFPVLDSTGLPVDSNQGLNVRGIRPVAWQGENLIYDLLYDTPQGPARVKDASDYTVGFRLGDWADEFGMGSIPVVSPKSALYQLDMPVGSKDRFMKWEDTFANQPAAVREAVTSNPIIAAVQKAEEMESTADVLRQQLAEAKKRYGLNPMTPVAPSSPQELKDLLKRITEATSAADDAMASVAGRAGLLSLPGTKLENLSGSNLADIVMGDSPAYATLGDTAGLRAAGVPGMKNLAGSTGRSTYNYAIWDQDLLNSMRVREIDGQRVPINPTTTVQQVEQRLPQAADSLLTSSMNPMALQAEPGYAAPAVAGAVYNALQAVNRHGGIQ